jgi:hypothetical protein
VLYAIGLRNQISVTKKYMIFLIFFIIFKKYFLFKIKGKYFSKIKLNFSLTAKYFLFTNFFNDKQIQKSLKIDFQKTIFRQTNNAFWVYFFFLGLHSFFM